MLVYAIKLKVL